MSTIDIAPARLGDELHGRITARLQTDLAKLGQQIDDDEAQEIIAETLLWLWLCAQYPEQDFSPSPLVDEGWHTFILYTWHYERYCVEHYGHVIHHEPDDRPGQPDTGREQPEAVSTLAFMREQEIPYNPGMWPERKADCNRCCSKPGDKASESKCSDRCRRCKPDPGPAVTATSPRRRWFPRLWPKRASRPAVAIEAKCQEKCNRWPRCRGTTSEATPTPVEVAKCEVTVCQRSAVEAKCEEKPNGCSYRCRTPSCRPVDADVAEAKCSKPGGCNYVCSKKCRVLTEGEGEPPAVDAASKCTARCKPTACRQPPKKPAVAEPVAAGKCNPRPMPTCKCKPC